MEHYFSEKPSSKEDRKIISYFYIQNFLFYTSSSVFSKDRVDAGTDVLIKNSIINEKDLVLDLGCGYGVVGITIAKSCPGCKITMTDVNERAVNLSKENLILNKISNAEVINSFLYENIGEKFDAILSNPPQSAGKEICMQIIEKAPDYLKPNGSLQIVARHNKGGKEFQKKMQSVFGNAETIARKSGYHVYISINK